MAGMVSLLLIGIAHGGGEPIPFCAITWSGSASLPSGLQMFISGGRLELLTPEESEYIAALLSDWEQLLRIAPGTLLALTRELSVGPIRTMRNSIVARESSDDILIKWLGNPIPYIYQSNYTRAAQ